MASTPVNKVRELPAATVRAWLGLDRGRFGTYGVHGDGTCFFHSVLVALNPNDYVNAAPSAQKEIAYEFRCALGDNLEDLREHIGKLLVPVDYEATPTRVREMLCTPRVWADELLIRHASKLIGANVIFLDRTTSMPTKPQFYCGVHGEQARTMPTVVIAWVNRSHFEPIVRIEAAPPSPSGGSGVTIQGLFDPAKRSHDRAVVDAVMGVYESTCKLTV